MTSRREELRAMGRRKEVREYEPIWTLIKSRKRVKITCAPDVMARVKKAVIKEKDIDKEFKRKCWSKLTVVEQEDGLLFMLQCGTRMGRLSGALEKIKGMMR